MTISDAERDKFIMEQLNAGVSLSDVQKMLDSEYGIKITYFELRMIASTLKIEWENRSSKPHAAAPEPVMAEESAEKPMDEAPEAAEEPEQMDDTEAGNEACNDDDGMPENDTVVTLDDVPAAGAAMSGTVKFASGASGKWVMTRMGQLGISELDKDSAQPTQDDIMLFQQELQLTMQARQEALEQQAFDGRTQVEISPLVRPGCDMNGSVTFASGAKGEWFIAGGRLEFELAEGSSEPTRDDKMFFQLVLSRKLKEKGY